MFWVCNYKATVWDSLKILLQNPQDWYKLIDDQHFILFASLKKWHFKKVTKKKKNVSFLTIFNLAYFYWACPSPHTHTVLMCPKLYCTIHQHAVRYDLQLEKGKKIIKKIGEGRAWKEKDRESTMERLTAMETEKLSVMWWALDHIPAEISTLICILDLRWSCSCYVSSHWQSSGGPHRQRLIFNLNLTRFTIFSLIPQMSDHTWRHSSGRAEERNNPLVTPQSHLLWVWIRTVLWGNVVCHFRQERLFYITRKTQCPVVKLSRCVL